MSHSIMNVPLIYKFNYSFLFLSVIDNLVTVKNIAFIPSIASSSNVENAHVKGSTLLVTDLYFILKLAGGWEELAMKKL